jgi:hypothetical protein
MFEKALNSTVDFGNFNEVEVENRVRSSLQIIYSYLKDVHVFLYVKVKQESLSKLILT